MEEKARTRALVVAALTCPCHAALLPLLVAGTTVGAALEFYLGWLVAGTTLVFLAALAVAFWRPREAAGASCQDGRWSADQDRVRMDLPAHEREERWQAVVRQ